MPKEKFTNSAHIDCSVIIPHYNQLGDLAKCLKALDNQQTILNYEVIVVDNESPSINNLRSQFPQFTFLSNPVKNPYTSRNLGIKKARSEYLGFLDARSTPYPDWLNNGVDQLRSKGQHLIAGRYQVVPPSSALKDQVYGLLYLNNLKNIREGYGLTAGNLFVTKELFEQIGYFNDIIISGNDIEWSKRAITKGIQPVYAPDVVVKYRGQSFGELNKKATKYAVGIRAQHDNFYKAFRSVFTYFLPMRLMNFQEALSYRNLDGIMWKNKCYLWLLVWSIKLRIAIAYLFHR